jgi:hypothetical protein
MFCVKGFVDGTSAECYFGFVAVVIVGINTAAINAARTLDENSGALQTFVTGKLPKGDLIKRTVRKPIASDGLHFPLWIKVPLRRLLLAASFRRHIRRLPLRKAANKHAKP